MQEFFGQKFRKSRFNGAARGLRATKTTSTRSRPARPMRADARRNYERLVDAARKVFADQGGGASMEAIAKQAGVGVGTLYRHFPKRIDVVEAVYRDDVDPWSERPTRGWPSSTRGRPWWPGCGPTWTTPGPSARSSTSCTRRSRRTPTSSRRRATASGPPATRS